MTDFPYLPLWTDNYLADTRHLTTKQHGAYLLLMMTAWRTDDCSLPDDDRLLARYCALGIREWKVMRPVLEEFFEVKDSKFVQSKLKSLHVFAKNRQRSNTLNGSKGGIAKALKYNNGALANATISPKQNSSEALASKPNHTKLNNKNIDAQKMFDEWWDTYPRKVSKKAALSAFQIAIKKIEFDVLMKATRAYATLDIDVQYIAYPTTYLNQERWNDKPTDIAQNRQPNNRGKQRGDLVAAITAIKSQRAI